MNWLGPTSSDGAVELETADGERISLERFAKTKCPLRPVLHVTTYTAAAFRENPRDDPGVFSPRFRLQNNAHSLQFSATTTDFLDVETGAVWERVAAHYGPIDLHTVRPLNLDYPRATTTLG